MTCGLLLESGDQLLLESADRLLAEGCIAVEEPTGGVRYGPVSRRPVKVRRRRRYLAFGWCQYRIVTAARHQTPAAHTAHLARVRGNPQHHLTTRTGRHTAVYGAATRHRTLRPAEVRCDLYRPPTPREVGDRLAHLYAQLS